MTFNIRIGHHFNANLYFYVEHDCVIGDFVNFPPAVRCNGNVVIQDHADTGMDAILKQGRPGALPPNDRARRGGRMDSMVTKNVPPSVTVVGNPAHPLVKD